MWEWEEKGCWLPLLCQKYVGASRVLGGAFVLVVFVLRNLVVVRGVEGG